MRERDEKNRGSNQREPRERDANRDPMTKEPGAHPVGTGVGATAGGAAGAAAGAAVGAATGTAAGGPIGTGVGIVAGAIAGGLGGKAVAEKVNPTQEEAYWRENYSKEPYYDRNYEYSDYKGAYQTGYEGYGRWGGKGKRFEDLEPEMRKDYEARYGQSRLKWDQARHASRAAWSRFDRNLQDYIGYSVVDRNDNKVGTLECLWSDESGQPSFLGVRTGWIFGKTHVVPAHSAHVSERSNKIRLPYEEQKVKDAPAYDPDVTLSNENEREIYRYYGLGQTQTAQRTSTQPQTRDRGETERTIPLAEEELKVGKRQVEAGGVRLRKIIRTETVNQPVQLQREEIEIERVPAGQGAQARGTFQQEDIYIPLRREEPVIAKEQHVREEVRVRKNMQTEQQNVSEQVRHEDVEIENEGEASRLHSGSGAAANRMREQQEKPRSQRQQTK